ncbi:MAG: molybdopterin-dependent oxidoreductase [Thermodesulfobacteriota bacterium]
MEWNAKDLMKWIAFNRRNFIKLLLGGAVGIHLTPLPWKLMDDVAIWTQNWSWIPVPRKGAFSHVKSVCLFCPGGCGIEVRKVDGRAVKIEGRTDYPVNPGGICPLGAGGLQLLYNESIRFTGPMKSVGPRGQGKFVEISWDEALKILAERVVSLRNQGRPEALAAVDGTPGGSTLALLVQRFLRACGSANYVRIPCAEDAYAMANRLMTGNEGPASYDLENADFILSFGCGLIEGWGAPGRMLHAWGLWNENLDRKRVRVVQVEGRASNTASKADRRVAPLPGTEAALALGLAHVIIREGLFHKDFARDHAFGLAEWTRPDGRQQRGFSTLVLERYSPEAVSKITGVPPEEILSLARGFARAKAPIALCGRGKGRLDGSLYEFMAVQALNALVGNFGRPGGVILQDPLPLTPFPELGKDDISSSGLQKGRLDLAGSKAFPFARSLIHRFSEAVLNSPQSPVDTLLVFSANPAVNLPDAGAFGRALRRIPFVVSFSPYRDETALMADLVLPDHTGLEKMEDVAWPSGLQYPLYGLSRPVIQPLYATRQTGQLLLDLARVVGGQVASGFPWKDYEECLKFRARGLFEAGGGLTRYRGVIPPWKPSRGDHAGGRPEYKSFDEMWQRMKSGGLWYRPFQGYKSGGSLFKTPSGRFEFYSTVIEKALEGFGPGDASRSAMKSLGVAAGKEDACLPHFEEGPAGADTQRYPLLLMPYDLINVSGGWLPDPHFLKKTLLDTQLRENDSFAEMNPRTASSLGLKQGMRVFIESGKGKIPARLNLSEGAMPGVVFLPLGFGHTAYDEYQQGHGANPNSIIEPGTDPLSGLMVWWKTRVRVVRA